MCELTLKGDQEAVRRWSVLKLRAGIKERKNLHEVLEGRESLVPEKERRSSWKRGVRDSHEAVEGSRGGPAKVFGIN